jgi:hypothetical protein
MMSHKIIGKDLLLGNAQECIVKSFGDKNPDKVFFVIRQEGLGRGLFSILSGVICYLDFADRCGFIPVVDFEYFKTEYNQDEYIEGTKNAFEYYFLPVSSVKLDEVYSSRCVVLSGNGYPKGYNYTIANIPGLYKTFYKYIKIRPEIESLVNISKSSFTNKVLGVHFRGQEMRTAAGHWFPPSNKQMFKAIDTMMQREPFDCIFVCTEDKRLLKILENKYPGMVISNDHFRTQSINAYKINPRKNHKYLLGREVLIDMLCLSKCDALISCSSNVAWMARFINNKLYSASIFINNGPNSNYWPLAKVLWTIKNILPAKLGGFKLDEKTIVLTEVSP